MGSDDRELRDRFEKLQVRTKQLRSQLDDPNRLDEVRTEVGEQLAALKQSHATALARLVTAKAEAEDARMRSMQLKRERAEANVLADLGTTGRVAFAISAMLGTAIAAAHWADPFAHLGVAGLFPCAAGAACFVALVYRMAADLRR